MSNDALAVVQCLFNTIWALFTSWHIPGTNVTPASFFLFLISAGIGLRYVLTFLHSPNASAAQTVSSARTAQEKVYQRHLADMMYGD